MTLINHRVLFSTPGRIQMLFSDHDSTKASFSSHYRRAILHDRAGRGGWVGGNILGHFFARKRQLESLLNGATFARTRLVPTSETLSSMLLDIYKGKANAFEPSDTPTGPPIFRGIKHLRPLLYHHCAPTTTPATTTI